MTCLLKRLLLAWLFVGLCSWVAQLAPEKVAKPSEGNRKPNEPSAVLVYSSPADEIVKTGLHYKNADYPALLAFSPDSSTLYRIGYWGTIKLHDGVTGKPTNVLQHRSPAVETLQFISNGTHLFFGDNGGKGKILDLTTRKEQPTQVVLAVNVRSLALAPDCQVLAEASSEFVGGKEIWRGGKIVVWDVLAGRHKAILNAHSKDVNSLAMTQDGKFLASGSADASVKLWDTEKGRLHLDLGKQGAEVNAVAFAPDGKTLASGMHSHEVKLWDTATGNVKLTLRAGGSPILKLAWSLEGRVLAASGCEIVELWDTTSGRLLCELRHSNCIHALAFSPNGRMLATGSVNNSLKLWNVSAFTRRNRLL
jgi:WD40 repeat protein